MIPYEQLSEKTQQILVRKSRNNGRLPAECLDIFEGQILYLVDAINALPGLVSNESCGGHAEKLLLPFVKFTLLEPAAAQRGPGLCGQRSLSLALAGTLQLLSARIRRGHLLQLFATAAPGACQRHGNIDV